MEDTRTTGAGWRVDPERADRLRWWTGSSYDRDVVYPAVLADLGRSTRTLSRIVVVLLVVVAVLDLAAAVLHVGIIGATSGEAFDLDPRRADQQLEDMDVFRNELKLITSIVMLGVAATWATWQYRVASMVSSSLLSRSPEAHAGQWFLPLGNLWLPFQNMRELGRAIGRDDRGGRSALLVSWWALFAVSLVMWMVGYPLWYVSWSYESQTAIFVAVIVGKVAAVMAARQGAALVLRYQRRATAIAADAG